MSEFVQSKGRRGIQGISDVDTKSQESLDKLEGLLEVKIRTIKESELMKSVLNAFGDNDIKRIRCLALGSPSIDDAALCQLAFLKIIVSEYNVSDISLYDPVFTPLDEFLFEFEKYKLEKEYKPIDVDTTLYFLPHAELDLTNHIINSENPKILLSNNILTHTERLIKSDLYSKYPILSKMVNILEPTKETPIDGFQPVKKRNRKSKKFIEKTFDHSIIDSYFTDITLISFKDNEEGDWNNAFTDLAYHKLT